MKYLILLFLLLLLTITVISCSNHPVPNGGIILSIERNYSSKYCTYYTNSPDYTIYHIGGTFNKQDPSFVCECGVFTVGDTIKITKQ